MFKYSSHIAGYVLLKIAEVPDEIKKIVNKIADKYKQYGVNPPSVDELNKLFPKDWQKLHGTSSAQEVLLGSDWMSKANSLKTEFLGGAKRYTGGVGGAKGKSYRPDWSPPHVDVDWEDFNRRWRSGGSYNPDWSPPHVGVDWEDFNRRWRSGGSYNPDWSPPHVDVDWEDVNRRYGDSFIPKANPLSKGKTLGLGLLASTPLMYAAYKAYQDYNKNKDVPEVDIPTKFKYKLKQLSPEMVAKESKPINYSSAIGGGLLGGLTGYALRSRKLSYSPRLDNLLHTILGASLGTSAGTLVGAGLSGLANKKAVEGRLLKAMTNLQSTLPEGQRMTYPSIRREYSKVS